MLKDISPSYDDYNYYGSNPSNLLEYDGMLYFTADNGISGTELWKTDGTEEGTGLLKDIATGDYYYIGSNPADLGVYDGKLYFTAFTEEHGREIFVSDGTEAGTKLFEDNYSENIDSDPSGLIVANGKLLFTVQYDELWSFSSNNSGAGIGDDDDTSDMTILERINAFSADILALLFGK